MPGVLHVADAEVVVELVVEIEGLLHMSRVAVRKLDAGLLPPEQVRHQAYEPRFGELMGMMPHGVVDAPDLHDGDDGAGRRTVRDRQIGAHLAVTKPHPDVLRLHRDAGTEGRGTRVAIAPTHC
jgi:hypothetical protein